MRKAYQDSLAAGGRLEAWNRQHNSKVYASVDEQEFWAEGAQAWFGNANAGNSGGLSVRGDVKTKEPALAALLTDVYGDGSWRYIKTTAKNREGASLRPAAEMEHLQGLESVRDDFPVFRSRIRRGSRMPPRGATRIRRHDKLGPAQEQWSPFAPRKMIRQSFVGYSARIQTWD